MLDKIKELYWKVWPRWARPSELWYTFTCWAYYRYTTVQPRTLPYHSWCDRDKLLIHMNFEILSQFIEKELKGYRAEDWEYYYTEQKDSLIEFGGVKKDPYYVLNYLYEWWKFYNEKEDKVGDRWMSFNDKHTTHKHTPLENSDFTRWDIIWDSPENEAIGKKMFNRYLKKSVNLDRELENNLILLIQLRKYLWT